MKNTKEEVIQLAERVLKDFDISDHIRESIYISNTEIDSYLSMPAFPGSIWQIQYDLPHGRREGSLGFVSIFFTESPLKPEIIHIRTLGRSRPREVILKEDGSFGKGRKASYSTPKEKWLE